MNQIDKCVSYRLLLLDDALDLKAEKNPFLLVLLVDESPPVKGPVAPAPLFIFLSLISALDIC